jgi:hypothetical protein
MVTLILEATALSVLVTWRSNVEWKPLTASPQKDRSTCLTDTKPQVVMLPEELPITGVTAAELEDEVVLVVAPVVDEVAAPVVDEEVALGWAPVVVVEAVVEVEVELVVVATEADEVVAVVLEAMQLTLSLGQREHVAD